jgi:hypothetical protein
MQFQALILDAPLVSGYAAPLPSIPMVIINLPRPLR